jgi:hypothetical protein
MTMTGNQRAALARRRKRASPAGLPILADAFLKKAKTILDLVRKVCGGCCSHSFGAISVSAN